MAGRAKERIKERAKGRLEERWELMESVFVVSLLDLQPKCLLLFVLILSEDACDP